jgi:hypothetical protein
VGARVAVGVAVGSGVVISIVVAVSYFLTSLAPTKKSPLNESYCLRAASCSCMDPVSLMDTSLLYFTKLSSVVSHLLHRFGQVCHFLLPLSHALKCSPDISSVLIAQHMFL